MTKTALWLTSILVGTTALAGVAAAQPSQKVLKVVPHADLRVLDGYQTTAFITIMHMAAIYDTLFGWDVTGEAQPQMVDDWSMSADKLKYTFSLRPGLKFHDGSPVTARDAVASVKRLIARETLGRTLEPFVASVDLVDDKTFTLSMKEPFGFTTFTLSGLNVAAGVMREKEASSDYSKPVTETIGSGPFRFVREEWQPGTRVVYAKNTDYVPRTEPPSGFAGGKVVKVDRVEYTVIPDAATSYAALQRGEVDLLDSPTLDLLPLVDKDPNITVSLLTTVGSFGVLRPNHLHPPFDNLKARQALALMVDQREYSQAAFGDERFWGPNTPCLSFWICGTRYGVDTGSEAYRKQNLERARQLMAESGYKGEKVVLIGSSDIEVHRALTLLTAENLKKIGVNVDLQVMEWGNVVARRGKKDAPEQGGWHLYHTTSGGTSQSLPHGNANTWTTCDKAFFGWPCDAEAERIRQQFMRETDPAKQKALAEAQHRRLWEAVIPYVPLGQYTSATVHRKNITGQLKGEIRVWWNVEKN
jgi:peptide/nickel transport system substrate-binding protein